MTQMLSTDLCVRIHKTRTDRIALTVCPLFNLKLCVFAGLADHALGALLRAELVATVNSDDPAYFGGYINDNFVQTFAATGLTAQQAYLLADNSFEASFIDATARQGFGDQLLSYCANFA